MIQSEAMKISQTRSTTTFLACKACLAVGAALVLISAPSLTAAEPLTSEYAWVEGGVSIVPDFDARLSAVLQEQTLNENLKLEMSPGFSAHGGFGERFLPWLSGEIEGGFYYNDVDTISQGSVAMPHFGGTLMQVPIMLNAVFHLPEDRRWVPFAGAGVGARLTWFNADGVIFQGKEGAVEVEDSSTEVSFAYQLFAGLRLNLQDDSLVALIYRFNGAISPDWDLKDAYTGSKIANLEADDLCVHTISLGFYMRF